MKYFKLLSTLSLVLILSNCKKNNTTDTGNNTTNNPLPISISISPNSALANSVSFLLTINGSGFVNSSIVKFNNVPLATNFVNSTQLTATVPSSNIASVGIYPVSVFSPTPGGGNSSVINFTVSSVAANNPIPNLLNITPNSIPAGSSSFMLSANGNNFVNSSVINWNGQSLVTNYVSTTQLTAIIPATSIATAGNAAVTVFSPNPGGGTSSVINFTITNATPTVKKFLFDASHAETAGNADWVIDEDNSIPQSIPTPAQSTITATTVETYWTGALSSWGIALAKKGYDVETLPATGSITYGNTSNTQDLSNYNVFVVDEPNRVFTASEKTAILSFVSNGGGLFMVSDHTMSDRDNDGWDSPAIWNDFMSNNGTINNPFGFTVDLANFSGITSNTLTAATSTPILSGTQGLVNQLQFNNGTSATLTPSFNANVKGLIWKTGATQNNLNVMSLSSSYGNGRVFFVGDSSPLDDGTGAPGNNLYVGWSLYSHSNLFMNASLWLAKVQ